jgi:hypothetical protein
MAVRADWPSRAAIHTSNTTLLLCLDHVGKRQFSTMDRRNVSSATGPTYLFLDVTHQRPAAWSGNGAVAVCRGLLARASITTAAATTRPIVRSALIRPSSAVRKVVGIVR